MGIFVLHDGHKEQVRDIDRLGFRSGTRLSEALPGDTVIRWSGTYAAEEAEGRRLLNAAGYTGRVKDKSSLRRVLAAHGIPCGGPSGQKPKSSLWLRTAERERLAILVFDMRVLAVQELGVPDSDAADAVRLPSKLLRLAVRAVYSAGLDFAEVTLRADRLGAFVVEEIRPAPALNERTIPLFAQAFQELSEAEEERAAAGRSRIQLGMDPEFLLLNPLGKIVPASRYLSKKGSAGYDAASVRGRTGVHPLVELRPEPSCEPDGLIRNLRRTMWTAASKIDDPSLQWIAGGMPIPGLPLGGHIHISGIRLNTSLVRSLDNYMALPLLMLEHESAKSRRIKYGRLGDVRTKAYGGFEYRTLPSMLVSPTITKGAVALTKLIATNHESLKRRPLDELPAAIAYYAGNKPVLGDIVDSLWQELTALQDYPLYAKYLEPIGRWISERRSWKEKTDFRYAWRIPPFHD